MKRHVARRVAARVLARVLAGVVAAGMVAAGLAVATPAAPAADDGRLARVTARCIKLMDLIACEDALNRQPNSPDLLVAEADALMQLKRPGEAIGVYRNALTVGARPAALTPRIGAAQALRRVLLDTCLARQGVLAEQACESAWLPGAADEVAVFKRRGLLLQRNGDSAAALDAYMAAARLAPRDRAVARAIIALAAATQRRDQAALTAVAAAKDRLRNVDLAAEAHGAATHLPAAPPQAAPVRAAPVQAVPIQDDTQGNAAEITRSN
jgi:tetratricopeptide (TPR) repeat protein